MCAPRTRQRPSPVVYVLCLSLLSLLVTCGEENRTLISEVALEELVSDNQARTKNNSDGGGDADDRDALRSEIVIDAGGDGADARTDPCVIYGSLETPQQNAWLFTIDLKGNVTQLLGPMLLKAHVPGLAVHPVTGELYALVVNQTGAKVTSLAKVDPVSGALEWIGQTGLDRVEGLSFRPTDATLWAWSRKHGLVRIDPATAAVEVVQDFRIEASALAWDPAGAVLYLAGNRNLWAYEDDPAGALRRVAQPLPVSIGGLAMRGDGQLLATAAHTSANTGGLDLLVYDPAPGAVAVTLHAPAVPVDTGRRADEAAARVEALTWPVACGNPSPGGDAEMILSIEIDRSEVCPGETIHVEVEAVHPEGGGNPVLVSIDGLPGSERTQQHTGAPGPRLINVSAWTPEGYADRGSETVQVIDCSPAESPARLFVGMNPFHPYTADFLVANADEIAPEGTVYEWEFGDGEWAQTDVPFVSHSYEASLEPDREYTSFEASVAVQRPGGTELWTPETVTVWNAYAANRKRGLIQPLTTSQPELIRSGSLLTGEYSLRNLEEGPITLTRRQIEQHPCDPDADPVALPWEAISLTLGPGEEVTETLELEADAVPEGVCGIALHLVGQAGLSRRVGTDVYFQVTANPLFEEPVTDAPTVTFLNDIAAQGLVPDPDYITDEDLYRLRQERRVVVPPSTMSLAASPRKHARAAMGNGGGGCACGCTHDTLPAGGPCACVYLRRR